MLVSESPLTPTLSPRKRVEREIRNFCRNFFGTVETAATGRPITIFLIAAREPAAHSKP
jgi:hypothetical protein